MKVFTSCVDDVIKTVKIENIDLLITIADKLHKSLQLTIKSGGAVHYLPGLAFDQGRVNTLYFIELQANSYWSDDIFP